MFLEYFYKYCRSVHSRTVEVQTFTVVLLALLVDHLIEGKEYF
jgi:hypothetical protein